VFTLSRSDSRRRIALFVVALALLFIPSGSPLSADSGAARVPFCREDGICLPPPRPASEVIAEARPEAPQAIGPATPCEAPLLVKREAHVTPRDFQRLLQKRGYAQIEGMLTPQWWRVCLPSTGPSAQSAELAALIALPEVAIAEPDGIATAAGTPNDPYYPAQWGLPKIGAPAAWDVTTGSSSVMIAVIDSGVDYSHPDSPMNLWWGWDFVDTDGDGVGDDDPDDDYGHGTHVMGIAAARTNNGVGVAGLCPGCSALAIKVLGATGSGTWSNVADGIAYAVDASAPIAQQLVINLSLGGPTTEYERSIVVEAIDYAVMRGAIVVAAAGNLGPQAPMFPASLPQVIAASASDRYDRTDALTSFTQYGDIAAPGEYIYSTWNDATSVSYPWPVCIGAGEVECYKYESGTSMASPFVAAAAGLVWSIHPEYSSFQVRLALLKNVDVPGDWSPLYGVGRLNVAGSVTAPEIVLHHVYLPLAVR
jgi:thermitase